MKRKADEIESAIRDALFATYGIIVTGDSRALSRAAIVAMRIPNTKMLNAAAKSMSPDLRPTPARVSNKAKHAIRYRAMLDVVLAEAEFERLVKPLADA